MRLILYGKKPCSLCDLAREVVEDVLDELPDPGAVAFEEVDIRGGEEALYLRYRHDVPVLVIDGSEAFRHRVDGERLRARLVDGVPAPLEQGDQP